MTNTSHLDQFQKNYPVELSDCSIHNISLPAEQTGIFDLGHVHIGRIRFLFQDFPCFVPESPQPYMAASSNLVSLFFFNGKSPLVDKNKLQDTSTTSPVILDIDQIIDILGKSLP